MIHPPSSQASRRTQTGTTSRCFSIPSTSACGKNFKVLTHKIEDGLAPIQKLAIPHLYNLTVNPEEDSPINYEGVHSWVLYKVFGPRIRELQESLKIDSVPFGSPLEFNPYAP